MINIAICDDEKTVCDAVSAACNQVVGAMTFEACSVVSIDNPESLIEAATKYNFDLILCDIYMPGIFGIDAIAELREAGCASHVIFITSSKDHAVDAFALHADNYLVKPFSKQQLADAVAPVIQRILNERNEFVNLKTVEGMAVHAEFAKIVYAETVGHNQSITFSDGSKADVRMSSAALFEKLAADARFFKAGSSYILNLDGILEINGTKVTLSSGDVVSIPGRLKKELQDAFLNRTFDKEK
jgi:DNA-binding LytR/AlgR family response regulator